MTANRRPRILPRSATGAEPYEYRQLPPTAIYLDDVLDIVELLSRQGPSIAIEVDAMDARWDDLDAVIDRAGRRTLRRMRIHAFGPDASGNNLEFDIEFGSDDAQLSWIDRPPSRAAMDEIAHTIMRRSRRGPQWLWSVLRRYSTIRFTRWGEHQGVIERNRDLIVAAVSILGTLLATWLVGRID